MDSGRSMASITNVLLKETFVLNRFSKFIRCATDEFERGHIAAQQSQAKRNGRFPSGGGRRLQARAF